MSWPATTLVALNRNWRGMVFAEGYLYAIITEYGSLVKIDVTTGVLETFCSLGSWQWSSGIAFLGDYFYVVVSDGPILKIHKTTRNIEALPYVGTYAAACVLNGKLYVTKYGVTGGVFEVDVDTGTLTSVGMSGVSCEGIVATDGFLYVAKSGEFIYRLDPTTGVAVVVIPEALPWRGIALARGTVFSCIYSSGGQIRLMDFKNGVSVNTEAPNTSWFGLASDGLNLYGSVIAGYIYKLSLPASRIYSTVAGVVRQTPILVTSDSLNDGSRNFICSSSVVKEI